MYGRHCEHLCPAGHMCPLGISEPIPCPPGSYAEGESNTECTLCPAGHFCPSNASPPVQVSWGYFAKKGSYSEFPCPRGMFCSADGCFFRPLCVYGFYHDGLSCVECPIGHYCTDVTNEAFPCQRGYYSPAKEMLCLPCPGGK